MLLSPFRGPRAARRRARGRPGPRADLLARGRCIAAKSKIDDYREQYANNQNISFLPAITSTSTRESSKTRNPRSLSIESLKTRAMPESSKTVQCLNPLHRAMPESSKTLPPQASREAGPADLIYTI